MAGFYYEARGFTPYYFAHVVFNLVRTPELYLRGLEDILGDMATSSWCDPYPRYSNLHRFIELVADEILFDTKADEDGPPLAVSFFKHYRVPLPPGDHDDEDSLLEPRASVEFVDALAALGEEVFHIMFHDVAFLGRFNGLVSGYIQQFGEYAELIDPRFTSRGRLKRVAVPVWVKDAIYHRDKGECRACKRRIDRSVRPEDKEFYDHIVPLARGGANDVTNLQLLCFDCNSSKSSQPVEASRLYRRAYPLP